MLKKSGQKKSEKRVGDNVVGKGNSIVIVIGIWIFSDLTIKYKAHESEKEDRMKKWEKLGKLFFNSVGKRQSEKKIQLLEIFSK